MTGTKPVDDRQDAEHRLLRWLAGATLEEVTVEYPDHRSGRPDLLDEDEDGRPDRIETILRDRARPRQVIDLAERSGLKAEKETKTVIWSTR